MAYFSEPLPICSAATLDAVGEHVAEALALAHHVEQLDHGLVVAEVQVDAAGVLEREDAALEELHGEGDGHAGRHGVEAVLVGHAVGGDDGVGVVDAGRAAERVERLVLGALGHDAGVGPRLREAHLAAGHRALGAGGAPGAARGDRSAADGRPRYFSSPVAVQLFAGKMPSAVQFSTLPEVPSCANWE